MQARTWILAAALAAGAMAIRHATHTAGADDAASEPVVAAREVAGAPTSPSSFQPVVASPKLAAPEVDRVDALRAVLAAVVDDGPFIETTGAPTAAVAGDVRDMASGEELAGVTVIATSPALDGAQTAITDENGDYLITNLPPGDYALTFYYMDATVERPGLALKAGHALHLPLVLDPDEHPRAPVQITLDDNMIINRPVPGRTFDTVLGEAAGSQEDGAGVSFTGVTSLENTYIVDGEGSGM